MCQQCTLSSTVCECCITPGKYLRCYSECTWLYPSLPCTHVLIAKRQHESLLTDLNKVRLCGGVVSLFLVLMAASWVLLLFGAQQVAQSGILEIFQWIQLPAEAENDTMRALRVNQNSTGKKAKQRNTKLSIDIGEHFSNSFIFIL